MGRLSLSRRLLVWILPIALGAVLLTGATAYRVSKRQILQDARKEVAAVTRSAVEQIQAFLEQRNNDLATIAQSPLFKDHYMNAEYGLRDEAEVYRREIERMLLDFSGRAGVYPRLWYVDSSGGVAAGVEDSRPAPAGRSVAAEDYFRALRVMRPGQRHMAWLGRVPWHGSPVIRYGMPLFDERKAFHGALVFHYSLSQVYGLLNRIRIGSSGRSYLTDRRGRPLEDDSPRSRLLTSSEIVPGTPWSVLTAVDQAELLDDLEHLNTVLYLLSLLFCAALCLVIVSHVRATTRPLQELAGAAVELAAGRLDVRVAAAGPAEVASLAEAFNAMAESLKSRTEDLEGRLRELSALQRMSDAVLRQLSRREIGRAFIESAVTGLGFDRGVFYRVDEARGEITGECAYKTESVGFTDESVRLRRVPLGSDDILAHAARGRETIYVEDPARDPRCNPAYVAETRTKTFCVAPVLGRERVLGVVGVDCRSSMAPITRQKIRSLSLFCSAAGLALENAELFSDIVRSEARYRTAIENSPDAIVSLDQNMRVTLWNRRAESLFGYQPTEAVGRTLDFALEGNSYRELKRQVETKGAVRQAEASGIARDGRRLELSVSWTGQPGERGGAREWFVVMQDVTEKKRLQGQLLQAEKMSAVGNLIAGVAHELNNPLAAVTGFAELLLDRPGTSEEKEDLRALHYSAMRASDIVQGLLLFARQGPVALHRVSLNHAVQAAIAFFEYRCVKVEGIRLEVLLDPLGPVVGANFQKLQQVLINLITNSCDALKGHDGPRIIHVRTRRLDLGSEAEVEDTGPGIPPDLRRRVFEPFFTTKPAGKGTGLGLSISSQIVSEFGGALRCEQGSAGGVRFVASFPPCPKDIPEPPAAPQLPPAVSGRRALVVDDEPDLVLLMVRLLTEDGLLAAGCTSSAEARRRLGEEDFDLVVADVDLGEARGTDLISACREATNPPKFILVTGDILNPALAEELARWNAPVLTKPFLRTDFLRLVRRALSRRSTPAG